MTFHSVNYYQQAVDVYAREDNLFKAGVQVRESYLRRAHPGLTQGETFVRAVNDEWLQKPLPGKSP